MFCGECGTKNNSGDAFCSECGAKLESTDLTKNTNNQPKIKKKIPKWVLWVIIGGVALIALIGVFIGLGINSTNPKNVAKDYIEAVVKLDGDKLYKYLELDGDTTFVSKKIFKDMIKNSRTSSNVTNYSITGVNYALGRLSAEVNFVYTTKKGSGEKSDSVTLTKQKGKKYLFFDNWKVDSDFSGYTTLKDYQIKVPKGAKLTFAGIPVDKKYLDSKKSTSSLDVYVLPQVFKLETEIKAVLTNGIEIENKVTPSSYYDSYTLSFDEDNLSEKDKTALEDSAKKYLNSIYANAIANKTFKDISSDLKHGNIDLTNLEEDYNRFAKNINSSSYYKLTEINFTDAEIYSVDIDDNGNFEAKFNIEYSYKAKYKAFNEEKDRNSTGSSYAYLTFAYDKGNYYLVGFDYLKTYFY